MWKFTAVSDRHNALILWSKSMPNNQQEPGFNPEDEGTMLIQNINKHNQTTEYQILDERTLRRHCHEILISHKECMQYEHPQQMTVSYLKILNYMNFPYDVLDPNYKVPTSQSVELD
jgi:hypothetical protein